MAQASGLQKRIAVRFAQVFGEVPNAEAIQDFKNQLLGIEVAENAIRLKEKSGDLLYALIAFITRNGWSVEDVIQLCDQKLDRRKEIYQSLGRRLRVGIYGGSFDPITTAHTSVAQYVMNRTGILDEVWFMPCYGHMYGKSLESPSHRLAMCELAATHCDGRIKVCHYEIDHKLSGSTYQTLKKMLSDSDYDQMEFYWIIGADCANDFEGWADFEHLNRMAKFIVVPRKGITTNASVKWYFRPPHIHIDPEDSGYPTKIPVSSSMVRQLIQESVKNGSPQPYPWGQYVVCPVYDYIVTNKLYALKEEQNGVSTADQTTTS